jgi:citrate synthase
MLLVTRADRSGMTMNTSAALRITDSRTGRSYEIPITDGAIRAADLRHIKESHDDFGLLSYDPGFLNTASCRSAITFIDGDNGILRYCGYPIEELARQVSFLDVAWLLLRGELPAKEEAAAWTAQITNHTYVHENVKKFIDGFHHDATRWESWSAPSPRCRPSIPRPRRSRTRRGRTSR